MAKIGIVTVLYNSESVLEDFFKTLNEQTYKDFVLYLVDNNSKDNGVELGKKLENNVSFECKWLIQKENGGVAKGNNIGICAALNDHCEYILLSNNDIYLEKDAIEKLLDGMLVNEFTMAVPKIYYWNTDKLIWTAGGGFKWIQNVTFHRGDGEKDRGQFDKTSKIDYAPTCFMLIKASVFDKVGFMDEKYFVYFDDTDFIWRATKYENEILGYVYDSLIWHKVSSCTGGRLSDFSLRYLNRNHIYFTFKHIRRFHLWIVLLYLFVHFCIRKPFFYDKKQMCIILSSYNEGWNTYKLHKRDCK